MLKILFHTALGVVLILIWSRFVNLGEIFKILSRVNLLSLIPVFLFMFLSPFLRSVRFKIFLSEVKKVPLLALVYLNGVSLFLNFFIPIRAGELAKGVYLNTNYGLHLGKALVWTFIDRFVDFLVVFVLAVVLFFIVPIALSITFNTKYQASLITVIIVILIPVLLLTYLAIFQLNFTRKIIGFLRHLLIINSIKIYFDRFSNFILESFSILNRHPRDLFLMILITILAYGADAAIWYFTFLALGVNQDYLKMYLGQLLSALTYLIPAAPGYVGSAEASGLLILSGVFGISSNLASAMIVLFHIASAVFVLIFGLVSIFSLKINLGLILKKALRKGD